MRTAHVAACTILAFAMSIAEAQQRTILEDYDTLIEGSDHVATLGTDLFGDNTDLYTGSTSFAVTDVSIPGNADLSVAVQRSMEAFDPGVITAYGPGGEFLKWTRYDVPYLSGIFKSNAGWTTSVGGSTPSQNRCSFPGGQPEPPTVPQSSGKAEMWESWEYWHGNRLNLPGGNSQLMLVVGVGDPGTPTTGTTYKWVSKDRWYFSCLPSTANGVAGEGFLALAPDGKKYYFDWVLKWKSVPALKKSATLGGTTVLNRDEYRILATRIEDRFGNWVTYSYSGKDLTAIAANDGRQLNLTYATPGGNLVFVTDGTRTWTYDYSSGVKVTFPDGSFWRASQSGPGITYSSPTSCTSTTMRYSGESIVTIEHPSGAVGTFTFRPLRRGLSFVFLNPSAPCPQNPKFIDDVAIYTKAITGPGLSGLVWNYAYGPANGCHTAGLGACTPSSPTTRYVEVSGPTFVRHKFGNKWHDSDSMLMTTEQGQTPTAILRTTQQTYQVFNVPGHGYAAAGDTYLSSFTRVTKTRALTQDGLTYNYVANTFDTFERPLSETRSNANYARTDVTAYEDNTTKWVLGQVKSVTNSNTGLVATQTDYDSATASPLRDYEFAKLQRTVTYNSDGTIASVKDGNNNITTFANWHRGIPRNITYHDGTNQSAVVNNSGWITSVTDENSFTISYGRDAMGRLASLTHPSSDSTFWNVETITFQKIPSADKGLSAGHWRHTRTRGNRNTHTYFDGLWRPVMVIDVDALDSSIQTQTITRYDFEGRVKFRSYPTKDIADFQQMIPGIGTTYDALGRKTSLVADSELGVLTTTTQYLTGNISLQTSPRGFQTQAGYLYYDEPSYDLPLSIAHPEGLYTDIIRDVFGKPTTITRRNANGSETAVRNYVYDNHQQLCKTIFPETGATVIALDGAGNVGWSASGLALPSPSSCDFTAALSSGRVISRSYDTRNRLDTVSFPDGNGNQDWSYTPDGLPAQIVTYNNEASTYAVNTYVYNRRRLLQAETLEQPGSYAWGIAYGYDANGSLASHTYPTGLFVDYVPNAIGLATKAGTFASGATYFPNGALKQFTFGNGVTHTVTQNTRQLTSRIADTGGSNPQDYLYSYDQNANVTSITDQVQGASKSRNMIYDGVDRLTGATSPMFGGTGTMTFTYDALDNIKSKALSGAYTHTYAYGTANRLASVIDHTAATVFSFTYDVQGNVVGKNSQTFAFDYGNRLRTALGTETYRYDGYGRRIQSSATSALWQYSQSGELLYQEDFVRQLAIDHIYLAGVLVASRESPLGGGTATVRFQHADALGTPVAVTSSTGTLLERHEHEPYGRLMNHPVADGPGFAGHVQDSATGFAYMQQRFLDPQVGRFLAVDPVTVDTTFGGSFNRYWYANNNPYRYVDPDGRSVQLVGPPSDQKKFIAQVYQATGIKVKSVNGTLVQDGKRTAGVGSELAAKVLQLALNAAAVLTVEATSNDPVVFGDSFATNEVDVADLDGFFGNSHTLGAAVLTHILNERAYAASTGAGFQSSHNNALRVESKVMGADTRTENLQGGMQPGAKLHWIYQDSQGKTVSQFNLTLDQNLTPH